MSPDELRLVDLVKRIADGDEGALAGLYDATVSRVNGIALRILRAVDEAEEVVADVFHQVWRQAPRFDPVRGSASAWIGTITRSRALDRLRQRERMRRERAEDVAAASVSELDAGPEDLLLAVERGHAVHEALRELSTVQRDLLARAFFCGRSHGEIADETGLPLGTVKTHIRRALQAMQSRLSGPEPVEGTQ